MKTPHIVIIVIVAIFLVWVAYGYFAVRSVENMAYTVSDDNQDYEIRQTEDHIIAEVTVTGDYQDATSEGFMKVADYIFGNNTSSDKVAMTTPVINSENLSEKVAMTTPVINSEVDDENKTRTIAFVMPSEYTMETLPVPNNDEVTLREVEGQKVAVLQFSWWASAERMESKKQELIGYLERDGLTVVQFQSARYNPPWTPPFMLRNEVWAILDVQSTEDQIAKIPETAQIATFAGGCFWCIENTYDNQDGVYAAVSGYVGGSEETASYDQVASGSTEHREAVQIYFDPEVTSYEDLLELFWSQIDPTDPDGQFVDKGYQYTTAIYTHNEEQADLAKTSLEMITSNEKYDAPIVTELLSFDGDFFLAEEEHQNYAQKQSESYKSYVNGSGRK